jgi:hypothetical protein
MNAAGGGLARWSDAGFSGDLLPLCGPRHGCDSPGKIPHVPGWRTMEITPAMVAGWGRSHAGNLGLRTRRFPAIDVDVEDAELADACERVVLVTLGSTAQRTRANTARRLLLFRLEGEPFRKAAVAFTTPAGERAKVEILADGQQCVVAGVHHTGAAIKWPGGQPVADELAPMTISGRDEVLALVRGRLAELGCAVEGPSPVEPRTARVIPLRDDTRDARIAGEALRRLSPDLPYDEWVRVGMALHSRWPDADGLALWDAWSSRGEKYPGTRVLERHWASFHPEGGVGFGTLVVMARRAG